MILGPVALELQDKAPRVVLELIQVVAVAVAAVVLAGQARLVQVLDIWLALRVVLD
jgi:hypothetical protein